MDNIGTNAEAELVPVQFSAELMADIIKQTWTPYMVLYNPGIDVASLPVELQKRIMKEAGREEPGKVK